MIKLYSGGSGTPVPPEPDPNRYEIVRCIEVGGFLVALMVYPGCTTFEGQKVLVFGGVNEAWLRAQSRVDPHFREEWPLIGRFRPDCVAQACLFAKVMGMKEVEGG